MGVPRTRRDAQMAARRRRSPRGCGSWPCVRRDPLSVSDLAGALNQSEPAHFAASEDSRRGGPHRAPAPRGRSGSHYRVAGAQDAGASFIAGLLATAGQRRDATLCRDPAARRARRWCCESAAASRESRLRRRALAGFLGRELAAAGGRRWWSASRTRSCRNVRHRRCSRVSRWRARAPRVAQAARAFARAPWAAVRGAGDLRQPDVGASRTPGAPARLLGTLVLDHPAAQGDTLARTLEVVRRRPQPDGSLWIFRRYEALESAGQRGSSIRWHGCWRLLAEAGLRCERLSPVEADGEHAGLRWRVRVAPAHRIGAA